MTQRVWARVDVLAGSRKAAPPQGPVDAAVERICAGSQVLAVVLRARYMPTTTEFITPADYKQQVGFVTRAAGESVTAHRHLPLDRHIIGTSEVLFVRRGRMIARLYDDRRALVAMRTLEAGDVILLVSGGHGFEMLEDTVLLEVKQGPYTGMEEKERFDAREPG